jgi:hypothetical protein
MNITINKKQISKTITNLTLGASFFVLPIITKKAVVFITSVDKIQDVLTQSINAFFIIVGIIFLTTSLRSLVKVFTEEEQADE